MKKMMLLALLGAGAVGCGGGPAAPSAVTPPPTVATTTTTTTTLPLPSPSPSSTVRENYASALSAGNAPCSSPGSIHDDKPCRTYAFSTSREGAFAADCNWSPRDTDIDLELWRGRTRLITTLDVSNPERMSSILTPGDYEVRVVYYQGTASTFFNLTFSHSI